MYEALYAPLPDVAAYAARLGLPWPLTADQATLDRILLAHQRTVPFENLQCYDQRQIPSLEVESLFRKIVLERRGGYCFELNALLERFLQAVGFEAWSVSCRIVRGKDFIPPMLHRGVLVRLDRLYYCDVGYGGPQPSGAVPLDGCRTIRGETFWGEALDDCWHALSRRTSAGDVERIFEFWTVPQPAVYFVPCNYYSASHPDSMFSQQRIVNLRTETGSLALTGTTLTERRDGRVIETALPTPEALSDALEARFGIPFSPALLRWEA